MKTKSKVALLGSIATVFLVAVALVGSNAFAVVAPEPIINTITPQSGSTVGDTQVKIAGSNFSGLTSVEFGETKASIISNTDTQIVLKAPTHVVGPADITITSGNIRTFPGIYTYFEPPFIQSLQMISGSTAGGTQVGIIGKNLKDISSVTFGGTAAAIQSVKDTQIVVTTGAHVSGTVDVKVGGTYGDFILPASFTYKSPK